MTIAEAIERWNERHTEQPGVDFHPAAVALTPRGDVSIALTRLRRQLRALDAEDRAAAAAQLRLVLAELEPTAATA